MEQEKISGNDTEKAFCEEWRPIKGYEGLYEISNRGNIKRCGRLLKLSAWNKYKVIRLRKDGNSKTQYVHRLVAQTFIPNPENKGYVNHIDCNKMNNSIENLEWCTRQENERHAWEHGCKEKIRDCARENAKKARSYIHNDIAVSQYTLDGCLVKNWSSGVQAMRHTGIDSSAIAKCCKGKLKTTGGFKWQYTQ